VKGTAEQAGPVGRGGQHSVVLRQRFAEPPQAIPSLPARLATPQCVGRGALGAIASPLLRLQQDAPGSAALVGPH